MVVGDGGGLERRLTRRTGPAVLATADSVEARKKIQDGAPIIYCRRSQLRQSRVGPELLDLADKPMKDFGAALRNLGAGRVQFEWKEQAARTEDDTLAYRTAWTATRTCALECNPAGVRNLDDTWSACSSEWLGTAGAMQGAKGGHGERKEAAV